MTSMMEKSLFYSSILVVSGILLGGGYFYGGDLYKTTFVSQKSDVETQVGENDFVPSAPSLEQSSSSTSLDDEVNQPTDYVKIK
jgi:hypothetical protein